MADIIQMLSIGKKQACVSLSTTAQRGSVWVSEGKVVHAVLGPETGEAAFFELMRWDDAEFLIKHGSVPPEESLDADAIYLLMEHFRRTDECTDEITSAVDATLVAEIGSAADHRA